jgi:hypothetical protein
MDFFTEARNLVQRYEKGDAFRHHVHARLNLILPVLGLFVALSIALSLGTIAAMEKRSFFLFLVVALAPVILIGSFALQAYVFFAWIELRALRPMLAHGPAAGGNWLSKLQARLGKPPPIPWISAAALVLTPFLLLLLASWKLAALVLVLAALTPVFYAHLDR